MFTQKSRRASPAVNAGSMADIAFLLLIFFLVTTTILQEEGVLVRLPVWDDELPNKIILDQEKVLTVGINGQNQLLVEGEKVNIESVANLVVEHLSRPDFPAKEAIVSLTHDRGTSYEVYLEVYDALLNGYRRMRDEAAAAAYGVVYEDLSDALKKIIRKQYPLVLSEAEPTEWGEE